MSELYIGLISGTSMDGIDAALVDFSQCQPRLVEFYYQAMPPTLRQRLQHLSRANALINLVEYGGLDAELGCLFANAVTNLLKQAKFKSSDIVAIGSHGQTVYHQPQPPYAFSLQIGDPNRIAELTGITTVADFRRRDLAVGGQGAPLVPAFHQAVFAKPLQNRVVVNIGGIANITVLNTNDVLGFDTGPGNTLMDYWRQQWDGATYDQNGDWAASGQVNEELVNTLLNDAYFSLPAPKSTGPEYFSPAWLNQHLQRFPGIAAADVQASLLQLSARSISQAIQAYCHDCSCVIVCGGGAHNTALLHNLQNLLTASVHSSADFGIHPDHVEAMAFAWLARQTLLRQPGNLPRVTGANAPVILGGIYPGKSLS